MALAGQTCCIDKLRMGQCQGHAPDVAGEEGDVDDCDRVEGVHQPWPQHRNNCKRQKDVGKGHQHVDAAHHQVVGPAARIAGDEADRRTDHCRDQCCRKADGHGDATAPDEAAEDVAPQLIRAEKVTLGEDGSQPLRRRCCVRIGQRQDRCQERDQHKHSQEAQPDGREAVM